MPEMNGRALALKLAPMRPEMRVVYMSGYTGFRDATLLEPQAKLLPKPFKRNDLLAKLRETMNLQADPQSV